MTPMHRRIGIALVVCLIGVMNAHGADLILNEYNAVRTGRWLDCDGMDCCCDQGVCEGGADDGLLCEYVCVGGGEPGAPCADDGDCSDGGLCEDDCAEGLCVCDPACKGDVFFGRVRGNGGNWFELVVTRNHADLRGWQLEWAEDPADAGTLTLTDDPLWSDLRAGTIITFTELDTAAGGLDTDVTYDPDAGYWWININTISSDGVPHEQYVTTITNVAGDGPGNFSVGNDNWRLTVMDAQTNVHFGPCGEDPGSGVNVNSREVFKLEEDPTPDIEPTTSNYRDGTSSTFGQPNVWSGGGLQQDFTCLRCDDGAFCNGVETCDADGLCQPGIEPCIDPAHCDESADACLQCITSLECHDGDPCTDDRCDSGACTFVDVPGCGIVNVPLPDTDGDGVREPFDECPGSPTGEDVDAQGCHCSQLDADEDGIDDCDDLCPGTGSGQAVDPDGCTCLQRDPDGDDDGDGIVDCLDQCPGTPPDDAADDQGCSCLQLDPNGDEDGDGVSDCLDQCPETPPDEEVDETGCTVDPAEDPVAPAQTPVDNSEDGGANNDTSSDEVEREGPSDSVESRRLCGTLGPSSLALILIGLATRLLSRRFGPDV